MRPHNTDGQTTAARSARLQRWVIPLALLAGFLPSSGASWGEEVRRGGPLRSQLLLRLDYAVNGNRMGDWRDGLCELRDLAASRGLPITEEDIRGLGWSWGGSVLIPVSGSFAIGAEMSFVRDENFFYVQEMMGGPWGGDYLAEYITDVNAFSRALQGVGAYYPGTSWGRWQPYVQVGLGYGSGWARFSTPSGGAEGTGGGLIATGLAGVEFRFLHASIGYRIHRFQPSYDDVRFLDVAGYEQGLQRFFFPDEESLRAFVEPREVDFSAWMMQIGVTLRLGHKQPEEGVP